MIVLHRQRPRQIDHELIWGSIGLLAIGAAWVYPHVQGLFVAACPLKSATGLPCVSCGGTRAIVAWFHARPLEAAIWNPLVAAGSALLTAYVPYALGTIILRSPRRLRIQDPRLWAGAGRRRAVILAVFAAVALNWAYLIAAGR